MVDEPRAACSPWPVLPQLQQMPAAPCCSGAPGAWFQGSPEQSPGMSRGAAEPSGCWHNKEACMGQDMHTEAGNWLLETSAPTHPPTKWLALLDSGGGRLHHRHLLGGQPLRFPDPTGRSPPCRHQTGCEALSRGDDTGSMAAGPTASTCSGTKQGTPAWSVSRMGPVVLGAQLWPDHVIEENEPMAQAEVCVVVIRIPILAFPPRPGAHLEPWKKHQPQGA